MNMVSSDQVKRLNKMNHSRTPSWVPYMVAMVLGGASIVLLGEYLFVSVLAIGFVWSCYVTVQGLRQ